METLKRARQAGKKFKFEISLSGDGDDCFVMYLKDMEIKTPLDIAVN